jgi:hypothetical protein
LIGLIDIASLAEFLLLAGAKVCCWICGGGLQEGYGAAAKGKIILVFRIVS